MQFNSTKCNQMKFEFHFTMLWPSVTTWKSMDRRLWDPTFSPDIPRYPKSKRPKVLSMEIHQPRRTARGTWHGTWQKLPGLPGLRAKAEYIRAPAVNNVSTPNLLRFEERVCWHKKSINQFPIPMHKTHVYVYVYVYIYIIYTWLLAFVKTLDPLWASKSLGFMDVPKIWMS
jgi:hypothetical protein